MDLAPENHHEAPSARSFRRARNVRKALRLMGYAYSLSVFLFACALALSVQGVAFQSLHVRIKAQLTPQRAHAQISGQKSGQKSGQIPGLLPESHSLTESSSRPIGAR